MSEPVITGVLNERYGIALVGDGARQTGRTAASTLFEGKTDEGVGVQIELFDAPFTAAADTDALNSQLNDIAHPGVFRPRLAGKLDDGRPFILRDAPTGTPLSGLIAEKREAGETVSDAWAGELLESAAAAVDAYIAAGHSNFLARSVNTEQMLVQHAFAKAPVKLGLVGPTTEHSSAEDILHDFWRVIAEVTGKPVDEGAAARHATAVGYLRAIAGSGVAPGPGEVYRREADPYQASQVAPVATQTTTARNPWPWIIGALALALVALIGAWWFTNRGQEWNEAEAQIHEAYPQIVAKKSGQYGWQGLTCESAATDPGQDGKIRCADENLGVTVIKYANERERNGVVPGVDDATVLGSGACMINDFEIPDTDPPAYAMAPRDNTEYLFIVNGADAETKRLELPLCE
ncbi:hypothetical protein [Corynebacterium glaucum]|uniref:hypothetical protein n=1 Tax=Corynebacterium glaucum TaxID=187491 RepID=UPI00265B6071|nr:hypothetical protein [Corynebacterium glaucum]